MQTATIITLFACSFLAVSAYTRNAQYPAVDAVSVLDEVDSPDYIYNSPALARSRRTKRGLILLKKKLLLGALGLKAAKVGVIGAGLAGAVALSKSKAQPVLAVSTVDHDTYHGYNSYAPSWNINMHSWSV